MRAMSSTGIVLRRLGEREGTRPASVFFTEARAVVLRTQSKPGKR